VIFQSFYYTGKALTRVISRQAPFCSHGCHVHEMWVSLRADWSVAQVLCLQSPAVAHITHMRQLPWQQKERVCQWLMSIDGQSRQCN